MQQRAESKQFTRVDGSSRCLPFGLIQSSQRVEVNSISRLRNSFVSQYRTHEILLAGDHGFSLHRKESTGVVMKIGTSLLTLCKGKERLSLATSENRQGRVGHPSQIQSKAVRNLRNDRRVRIPLPQNLQLHNVTYCGELIFQIRV